MSSTNPSRGFTLFATVTALLSVAAIGFGLYELWHVARFRQNIAALTAQNLINQANLQQSVKAAQANAATIAKLRQRTADRKGDPADQARAPRAAGFSRADWEKLEALNPQVRGRLADIHRAQLSAQYRAFFEQANLTPAQIEEFLSRSIAMFDQSEVMSPNGGFHPTSNQLPDDELKSILGEQGFEAFQDYKQKLPAVGVTNQAAAAAAAAGFPLSLDQQARLAQILANNNDGYANNQHQINNVEDFAAASAQAQGIMTATQWNAAKASLLEVQYLLELRQARQAAAGASSK